MISIPVSLTYSWRRVSVARRERTTEDVDAQGLRFCSLFSESGTAVSATFAAGCLPPKFNNAAGSIKPMVNCDTPRIVQGGLSQGMEATGKLVLETAASMQTGLAG